MALWPHINPSDIWWFLIYRAYCDPYNHPAQYARLDFTQSWKRTGGWALEEILIRHYGPFLRERGVNMFIADGPTKARLVRDLTIADRVEADKIDVVLTGEAPGGARISGSYTSKLVLLNVGPMTFLSAPPLLRLATRHHFGPWTVKAPPAHDR